MASAGRETAPLVWDVTGRILGEKPSKPLRPKELDNCWVDLAGSDGAKAWKAILALEARPVQAAAFIKQRLTPNPKLDAKRLVQLQAELNHDNFQIREQAAKQWEVLGQAAGPSLRKILASEPPVEVRKRVSKLLEKIAKGGVLSEEIRSLRALEVLESLGTPEARKLLEAAAEGEPAALVTQDAQAALGRLKKRPAPAQP